MGITMNYSITDHGQRYELDVSWEKTDLTFQFESVFKDETGDIEFNGTGLENARINQASGDDIGVLVLRRDELTFEARANYEELVRDLAKETEFHEYDEPKK
jgi:hypothetical protein